MKEAFPGEEWADREPEVLRGTSVTGFEQRAMSEDDSETFDVFPTAMKNNFEVGKVIIEAILNGELG